MTWYYAENNSQQGPVSDEQLGQLAASGRVNGSTLVWKAGMGAWTALEQAAPELLAAPALAAASDGTPASAFPALGPETALCSTCNQFKPLDQIVMISGQRVCATCKPVVLQKLKQGDAPVPTFRYGGFWIRFAARFLDGLILQPVSLLINMLMLGSVFGNPNAGAGTQAGAILLGTLIGFGYSIFFLGRFGATPGKMVAGLRVVREDGSPLGYGLATGRVFADLVSALTLGIGYLIAAFDVEKRALHDRICNTRVIYKKG